MSTFTEMSLPPFLAQRLLQAGFTAPTPIQQAAIQPALEGRDIMAQAKTGSGKTLAFLLPMIERALRPAVSSEGSSFSTSGSPSRKNPRFLILAPTRELALQIEMELRKYAPPSVSSLAVYGGTPIERHHRRERRRLGRLILWRICGCTVRVGYFQAGQSLDRSYQVDAGPVESVLVTTANGLELVAADPEIVVPSGHDLTVWFEGVNVWGCHEYDSDYGANYHFSIIE